MPAGLGGGGSVGIAFETTMGTYAAPTVFAPIISESLMYTEEKYYSPQIRQTTIVSDVKQSFYHIEGDLVMEVDTNNLPYFLYCSRHTPSKVTGPPIEYNFVPSNAGSASTATGVTTPKTMSITIVRNNVVFGYTGCVMGGYEFTIEEGVLRVTWNVLGLAQATQALPTPVWLAPNLLGASAHSIFVAASGAAPPFGAASVDFNGFTFNSNFNASAQNRIVPARSATYIAYGETEATYTTELDFIDKTEYDLFQAAATRAIRLESIQNGGTYGASTDGVSITVYRSAYDAYDISLPGMGDLIMAGVTGRVIGQTGALGPYRIQCKSAVNIT